MGEEVGLDDERLDQTGALQRHLCVDLRQRTVGDQIVHQPGTALVARKTPFGAQLAHALVDRALQRRFCLGRKRQDSTETERTAAPDKLTFIQQHAYEGMVIRGGYFSKATPQ